MYKYTKVCSLCANDVVDVDLEIWMPCQAWSECGPLGVWDLNDPTNYNLREEVEVRAALCAPSASVFALCRLLLTSSWPKSSHSLMRYLSY